MTYCEFCHTDTGEHLPDCDNRPVTDDAALDDVLAYVDDKDTWEREAEEDRLDDEWFKENGR